MTKFMIQDIVPPGKKRPPIGTKKTSSTHDKSAEHTREDVIAHPAHSRVSEPHRERSTHELAHHDEPIRESIHETEIEDMLPENPRAMILEHLYEEAHPSEKPLDFVESHSTKTPEDGEDEMASGTWPYNSKKSEDVSDPKRRILPQFPSYKGDVGSGSTSWVPWVLIPGVVLISAFFLFSHFARADISIIPKSDAIPFEEGQSFSALKNPTANDLGYAVMRVTLDDTIEVPATGTKTVTAKASGSLVVYNEQTTTQRLIKNTRFESPTGKIYRINDSIVVPKATTDKTGKLIPGTLEVKVYADEAGPDYNSDPTDFTVPGLKNLPQYKKVYARSKTALTGGASGTIKSVSDQDLRQASENLRVSLETKLRSKARGDISPSQIGYDQGIVIDLKEPVLSTDKASREDKAVVTENGSLYLVVFDRAALTQSIAKTLIPTYDGEAVSINNLDSLVFAMPETQGDALWKADKISFTLSGKPEIVWVLDEDTVKKSLLSIPKSNFNSVMAQFTTIERANATLRPFWKSTYPSNPDDIIVKVVSNIAE